jgi:hypothetical protein
MQLISAGYENTKYFSNRFVLQCLLIFTWRVSDCEESVGSNHSR